ncbi:beta-glucosidase 40-like [Magnolia sinica]|uniref:beta-glucosidase 40-like n=1 Tax=Magnolia sinica TaxID=86752 RepID=UPI0026597373|nr:beta-glucosidase 40-like [Magnolia sinica]
MTDMGLDAYRFSISWTRIFPYGNGIVNQAGIDYYNNLIDALIAQGLVPFVTLYHWDLPQALHDSYGGWLSPRIINDFVRYAEVCFKEFGDRVKHWITFNEPHNFVFMGYDVGLEAPGRCSIGSSHCKIGNSSTEPYIVAHNVLLSHAATFRAYQAKFKGEQGGSIGISLDMMWLEPMSNSTQDVERAQICLDFQLGWFLDPLYLGDYPSSMRERAGGRLPKFSKEQLNDLKGSLDFLGINHYTTNYAMDISNDSNILGILNNDTLVDAGVIPYPVRNGVPIGEMGASSWLFIVPWGMRKSMNYLKNRYGNPPVIITENGIDEENERHTSLQAALEDQKRIDYHRDYLSNLSAAINEDGCNVRGYFAWSLLDNWEWTSGFSVRFGLYFVDYNSPALTRYAKKSVEWFSDFLQPF